MDPQDLTRLARELLDGGLSPEEFVERLTSAFASAAATTAQLDAASLDLDRRRRCGFPEVVYGQGKSTDVLRDIIAALADRGQPVLVTRVAPESAAELLIAFPTGRYNEVARTFRVPDTQGRSGLHASRSDLESAAPKPSQARLPAHTTPWVAVVTAGTSDLPVAEEVRETLDWMGVGVRMIHDVGVAGPHRLPARLAEFEQADAVVVVAGMEGALPSIVGGYVACPVIGVPTSIGYGASFAGVAALLSMLNSCASNVAVVNIDAGFKAGYLAGLIATRRHELHSIENS